MDTRDSRRPPAVERSSGIFFSLYYFSLQNKGIAATEILFYMMHSLWTLVGRSLSRLLHRLDGETVTVLDQPVVEGWRARGVPWGGSAGFQDCSGKDCLKLKRFFSLRKRCEGGRQRVSSPRGDENDKNKANNLSACLLGSWWRQHLCLSQPLLKSYFTFGWIYFSVKKKEKKTVNAL